MQALLLIPNLQMNRQTQRSKKTFPCPVQHESQDLYTQDIHLEALILFHCTRLHISRSIVGNVGRMPNFDKTSISGYYNMLAIVHLEGSSTSREGPAFLVVFFESKNRSVLGTRTLSCSYLEQPQHQYGLEYK